MIGLVYDSFKSAQSIIPTRECMSFKCSLEEQRKLRKRYREKHKSSIAARELPKQKEKRDEARENKICIRCFKNVTLDTSYCNDCLDRQVAANTRYRLKKKLLTKG